MPQKTNPQSRLADAALRILAKKAWRDISLADVARTAKMPMLEVAAIVPAKPALLGLILRRFGNTIANTYKPDREAESGRDRLFDVGMAWFDAMTPHKKAIRALHDGFRNDPLTLLTVRSDIVAAAEWLMTLAEADKGPALSLRAVGFAAALGRAIPVWLDDDRDLTKTMARLDGDLRRGESWLGRL
jgi:AcrR family transcriptional regulator